MAGPFSVAAFRLPRSGQHDRGEPAFRQNLEHPLRPRDGVSSVTWTSQIGDGSHTGRSDGRVCGYIVRTSSGSYVAFDAERAGVGRYDTLAAAKRSIFDLSCARRNSPLPKDFWAAFAAATVAMVGAGVALVAALLLAPYL